LYKIVEKTIKDKSAATDKDEMIELLGEAIVDEYEYLRCRITERFSETTCANRYKTFLTKSRRRRFIFGK